MELPDSVIRALEAFVGEVQLVFKDRLNSVVLYGSAAEGRLRKTSDVNVVVVTRSYTPSDAAALTPILTFASVAIDLHVMFILEDELGTASQLFAVKFSDITRRHKVLFGVDPFQNMSISREALLERLKQVLLNHLIRMRYAFALRSESATELAQVLAESVTPLRVSASSILEIRGATFESPKHALEIVANELREDGYRDSLAVISEARSGELISMVKVRPVYADMLELMARMNDLMRSVVHESV